MMDMAALYHRRKQQAQKEQQRYLKLLFNDHFVLFLFLCFGLAILALKQAVQTDAFATANRPYWYLALTGLALFFLHLGQLDTQLKQADAIFLLGAEEGLAGPYLREAWRHSLRLAFIWQGLGWFLMMPILLYLGWHGPSRYGALLLLLLAMKAVLLQQDYRQLFVQAGRPLPIGLRLLVGCLLCYLFFCLPELGQWVLACLLTIFAGWALYDGRTLGQSLSFERTLAQAGQYQQRRYAFYRLFAEVPKQTTVVKRHAALDVFLKALPFQKDPLQRLYWLSCFRAGEQGRLIVRLTLLLLCLLPFIQMTANWGWICLGAGFAYLLELQLLPIADRLNQVFWTRFYFVHPDRRRQAFARFARKVTGLAALLVTLVLAISQSFLAGLFFLLAACLTSYLWQQLYLPKKRSNS
ncbi:ABC transporter permease [Leuconostocaceae bacterium ESL0958]|nr:ABC transporter permease [Leuconostocaceae bacterium ESL0958]